MKTILLPITGGTQLEVIRNALAQLREAVQENIDVLDVEDDVDNIEAFERELLAIDSIEGNLDDAREGKIVAIIEGGLVQDVFCSHHAVVFVADRDVEADDRNVSDDQLADLIADLKEVY